MWSLETYFCALGKVKDPLCRDTARLSDVAGARFVYASRVTPVSPFLELSIHCFGSLHSPELAGNMALPVAASVNASESVAGWLIE